MPKFTIYCVVVYRSKKDPNEYMMSTHTLSGDDISERLETTLTVDAKSRSKEWKLVSFSHAFLPFEVRYQI